MGTMSKVFHVHGEIAVQIHRDANGEVLPHPDLTDDDRDFFNRQKDARLFTKSARAVSTDPRRAIDHVIAEIVINPARAKALRLELVALVEGHRTHGSARSVDSLADARVNVTPHRARVTDAERQRAWFDARRAYGTEIHAAVERRCVAMTVCPAEAALAALDATSIRREIVIDREEHDAELRARLLAKSPPNASSDEIAQMYERMGIATAAELGPKWKCLGTGCPDRATSTEPKTCYTCARPYARV